MLKAMHEAIQQAIAEAADISIDEVVLEHPTDLSHGDYSTNIALVRAKQEGKNPREYAEHLATQISLPGIERIEVAGPGFINFHLARPFFSESLSEIVSHVRWGSGEAHAGKKVLLEYGQPNPFKPFHIGHLMSITIGESLSRLYAFSGAEVFRANYQGDIGPHVAKCIWGLIELGESPDDVEALGRAYVYGNNAYEESEEDKAEIDALNKKLYAEDPEVQDLYVRGREVSLEKFEEVYALLGTRYDAYFFEGHTAPVGKALVEEGLKKGIFTESNGAVVYEGEKHGLHTRVFITAQGNPTYEAKELGLAQEKARLFPFDINITTVAVEQKGYFEVVSKAIEEVLPQLQGAYTHVCHGMMQLTGGKMSSRKGNIITGESLINDMRTRAAEKMQENDPAIADMVAVGGIKYSVLKQATGKNITFDPEQSLSLEGDSGPYMQYALVRARKILADAQHKGDVDDAPHTPYNIEKILYRFPEVVERATREHEPHYITTFLIEVAGAFNSFYAAERILGDDHEAYKLLLTEAVVRTLENGLWLLGIPAPEKM